jgi:NAD(P)-dependent dehydrogenase (short-subunit alcohol dehydrogenase family)
LEEVAHEITNLGRRSLAISVHMGKLDDISNLVEKILEEFGRIDILVNNAGTNPVFVPVIDIEEETWDKIFEVNLKGYFFLCQQVCTRWMRQNGGRIVNVASTTGISPDPGLSIYSISKAGVIMLTRVLAAEWDQYNIRVNAIAPGLVKTRFSQTLWGNPDILSETLKRTPLGRIAEPQEMVGAILYLASEAPSFVTGQTIVLDGGSII